MAATNTSRRIDCKTVSDFPWSVEQAWLGNKAAPNYLGVSLEKPVASYEVKRNLNLQYQQKGGGNGIYN